MTDEKTVVKADPPEVPAASPQKVKVKGRGIFYYIDGFLIRLTLVVMIIAMVWNWDGFWQSDIKTLNNLQKKYFPIKYETMSLKMAAMDERSELYSQMNERTRKYVEEKDNAIKAMEEAKAELAALKKEAASLHRYYDTSLRIIKQLNRKFSPDELEATLKCNSLECENIVKSSPDADPGKFVF